VETGRLRIILLVAGICLTALLPLFAQTPEKAIGFWKTIDDKEGFTTSIMAVYTYEGELFGRIIVSFDEKTGALLETHNNPIQRIKTIPEQPKLLEIDLFWRLKRDEKRWRGGKILDPRSGKTFTCDCWVDDGKLIIRGKVGPFGLNSVFLKATTTDFPTGYSAPEIDSMRPNIPHL
jgi:uncharacterized protein (DUF2147 family)